MAFTDLLPLTLPDAVLRLYATGAWDVWSEQYPALGAVTHIEQLAQRLATETRTRKSTHRSDPSGGCGTSTVVSDDVIGALLAICADYAPAGTTRAARAVRVPDTLEDVQGVEDLEGFEGVEDLEGAFDDDVPGGVPLEMVDADEVSAAEVDLASPSTRQMLFRPGTGPANLGPVRGVDGALLISVVGHLLARSLGTLCAQLPAGEVDERESAVLAALWLALYEPGASWWASPKASLLWRVRDLATEDVGGYTRREATSRVRIVPAGGAAELDTLAHPAPGARSTLADPTQPAQATPAAAPVGWVVSPWTDAAQQDVAEAATTPTVSEDEAVARLLVQARRDGVLGDTDVAVLSELLSTAARLHARRGLGAKSGPGVEVTAVAARRGVSPRTIRRLRARAIRALQDAARADDTGRYTRDYLTTGQLPDTRPISRPATDAAQPSGEGQGQEQGQVQKQGQTTGPGRVLTLPADVTIRELEFATAILTPATGGAHRRDRQAPQVVSALDGVSRWVGTGTPSAEDTMTDSIDSTGPHPTHLTTNTPDITGTTGVPRVPGVPMGGPLDGPVDTSAGAEEVVDVQTLVAVARDSSLPVIITRLEGLLDDLRAGQAARACLAEMAPADLIAAFATTPKPDRTAVTPQLGHHATHGAQGDQGDQGDDVQHRRAS